MRIKRVLTLAAPILLYGTTAAFAAGSGTPLDPVATELVTVLSGPAALIMIACGFVGAGIIYLMSRDFGHAFITLGALTVAGVLMSQIQAFATYFFPAAIALIR